MDLDVSYIFSCVRRVKKTSKKKNEIIIIRNLKFRIRGFPCGDIATFHSVAVGAKNWLLFFCGLLRLEHGLLEWWEHSCRISFVVNDLVGSPVTL